MNKKFALFLKKEFAPEHSEVLKKRFSEKWEVLLNRLFTAFLLSFKKDFPDFCHEFFTFRENFRFSEDFSGAGLTFRSFGVFFGWKNHFSECFSGFCFVFSEQKKGVAK